MSASGELLLQSTFPSLEVTVVSDIYSHCNSDVEAAAEQLFALFPEAYAAKDQGQAQSQEPAPEAWTPPIQSPAQSPKKLSKNMNSPPGPSQQLNSKFLQIMFPKSPGGPKKDLSKGSTNANGPPSITVTKFKKLNCGNADLRNDKAVDNGLFHANDKNERQVANQVHASLPFLQHLLPMEKPSGKVFNSMKLTSGNSTDLSQVCTNSAQ